MKYLLEGKGRVSPCGRLLALLCGFLFSLCCADAFALPLVGYDLNGNLISQRDVALAAPTIVTQPRDALLQPGGTVRFFVVASGAGLVTYQWKLDGANVSGATNDTLAITGLATNLSNYGQYTVVVGNSAGSVTSASATVFPDTDADNMADAREMQYFQTLTNLPSVDRDGDGVADFDEIEAGSSPTNRTTYLTNAASWFQHAPASCLPALAYRWPAMTNMAFFAPGRSGPFSVGGLGSGMSINPDTGALTFTTNGTPSATGLFTLSVTAPTATGLASRFVEYEVSEVVATGATNSGQCDVPRGLVDVVEVAAGGYHGLALKADGTVVAWGGKMIGVVEPQAIVPAGLTNVVAVAAGRNHSLVLKSDGTVTAWGSNDSGQTSVPAGLTNVLAVAAGPSHCLALKANGTVSAWGDISSAGEINAPAGLTNAVAVAAGYGRSLALKADGTVVAWGGNWGGPELAGVSNNTVAIAAGDRAFAALDSDGVVRHWGIASDVGGSCPDGFVGVAMSKGAGFSLYLFKRPNAGNVSRLIAPHFALGYTGNPMHVRVMAKGDGITFSADGLPPGVSINAATGVISGAPAQAGSYNVTLKGTGPAGETQKPLKLTVIPVALQITSALSVRATSGGSFTYQITAFPVATNYGASGLPTWLTLNTNTGVVSGAPVATGLYGYNVSATTYLGSATAPMSVEVPEVIVSGTNATIRNNVPPGLSNVVATAAGLSHGLALKYDGTVTAWGTNNYGQTNVPAGLTNAVAVAAGGNHSLVLRSDGTVSAWGDNSSGQTNTPSGLTNVVAVAAGYLHCLSLKSDGRVSAWGDNGYGQRSVPFGLANVIAVAAGWYHNLALRADGTVVAWGHNNWGQTNVPAGLTNAVAVSAWGSSSLALRADGTVQEWGYQSGGMPAGLTNVVAVAAGNPSLALKSDGTVSAWNADANTMPGAWGPMVAVSAGDGCSLGLLDLPTAANVSMLIAPHFALGYTNHPVHLRVSAKGTGVTFSASGLPDGLSIDGATGLISGTPMQTGTYAVTLKGSGPMGEMEKPLRLIVLAASTTITSFTLSLSATNGAITADPLRATYESGETVVLTAVPNAGYEFSAWSGDLSGVSNPATVIMSTNRAVTANFVALPPLGSGLSPSGLTFTRGGNANWFMQTEVKPTAATSAARSGNTADSSTSYMETTVTGPGTMTYWRKVSSENGYDFLRVFLDGVQVAGAEWSGEQDWAQQTLSIPAGAHTVRWQYSKDRSVSSGVDAAFVAQVVYVGPGFSSWSIAPLLPENRRGPMDRNGPMNLPNFLSYSMALDPRTATQADMPALGQRGTDTMKFIFRRAKNLSDADLRIMSSTNLSAPWSAADVRATTILQDGGDHEKVEATVGTPQGATRFFLRLQAEQR